MAGSKQNIDKTSHPDNQLSLKKILEMIRKDPGYMDDLVSKLEESQKYMGSYYDEFCQSYTIALLKKYCHSPDDLELMLAAYGLLQGLDYSSCPKLGDRREKYWQHASAYNKRLKTTWGETSRDKLIRDAENEIIAYLDKDLTELVSQQGEKLNLLKSMKIPQKTEFPIPKYLCPHSNDMIDTSSNPIAMQTLTYTIDQEDLNENKPDDVGNDVPTGGSPVSPTTQPPADSPAKAEKDTKHQIQLVIVCMLTAVIIYTLARFILAIAMLIFVLKLPPNDYIPPDMPDNSNQMVNTEPIEPPPLDS